MNAEKKLLLTKKNLFTICLVFITAILITWTGIAKKQETLNMIPLYVSLIVSLLQTRANRYASLIGGINSLIYAAVYFSFKLYASAGSCILISFPFQVLTFIRWSKNAYKQSTTFRRLTPKQLILTGAGFVLSFVILQICMTAAGSSYRMLDNTLTLIGILVYILTLFSFIEYSWLMLLTGAMNIVLNIQMMIDYPAQITYLIYSLYSFVCIIMQFFAVRSLYKEQRALAGK